MRGIPLLILLMVSPASAPPSTKTTTFVLVKKCNVAQCPSGTTYHCLTDEDWNLGQVCMARRMIQRGMCPYFNTYQGNLDARVCMDSTDPKVCPEGNIYSNEGSNYKNCLYMDYSMPTVQKPETTTTVITTVAEISSNDDNIMSEQQVKGDSDNNGGAAIGIIVTIMVLIILGVLSLFVYVRIQRERDPNFDIRQHIMNTALFKTIRGQRGENDSSDIRDRTDRDEEDGHANEEEALLPQHICDETQITNIAEETMTEEDTAVECLPHNELNTHPEEDLSVENGHSDEDEVRESMRFESHGTQNKVKSGTDGHVLEGGRESLPMQKNNDSESSLLTEMKENQVQTSLKEGVEKRKTDSGSQVSPSSDENVKKEDANAIKTSSEKVHALFDGNASERKGTEEVSLNDLQSANCKNEKDDIGSLKKSLPLGSSFSSSTHNEANSKSSKYDIKAGVVVDGEQIGNDLETEAHIPRDERINNANCQGLDNKDVESPNEGRNAEVLTKVGENEGEADKNEIPNADLQKGDQGGKLPVRPARKKVSTPVKNTKNCEEKTSDQNEKQAQMTADKEPAKFDENYPNIVVESSKQISNDQETQSPGDKELNEVKIPGEGEDLANSANQGETFKADNRKPTGSEDNLEEDLENGIKISKDVDINMTQPACNKEPSEENTIESSVVTKANEKTENLEANKGHTESDQKYLEEELKSSEMLSVENQQDEIDHIGTMKDPYKSNDKKETSSKKYPAPSIPSIQNVAAEDKTKEKHLKTDDYDETATDYKSANHGKEKPKSTKHTPAPPPPSPQESTTVNKVEGPDQKVTEANENSQKPESNKDKNDPHDDSESSKHAEKESRKRMPQSDTKPFKVMSKAKLTTGNVKRLSQKFESEKNDEK